ncbi:hypothetical protein FHS78_001905 [Parvibaculum indicum]|uniref:outer membrane beta-barrel protein n=1 Tax=Parvibaculum indicum TaxID=562969 RepID=UPI0014218930|nr:outer membrane beta-barrel protein [Parvibaculum indicum]NIJ41615.1 hypothetical protein [Parvibaculum indicum]
MRPSPYPDFKLLGAVLLAASLASAPALAQQAGASPSDGTGVHVGAFMVYPQASYSGTYNDNIYADANNEQEDYISTLKAAVDVSSTWSRHALNLTGSITKSLYADRSSENRLDWNIGADGRLDITRNSNLTAGTSYSRNHEDRGSANAAIGAIRPSEPIEYDLFTTEAKFHQGFNRLFAEMGGKYSNYDYKNATSVTGTALPQDYRDRERWDESLRLGYMVSPDTNVFVEGSLNQRTYDKKPPAVAVNRDSDGYAIVGGAQFRLTNLVTGEISAGYQEQHYDAGSDVSGLKYGASVTWSATTLTTVTLNANSSIEETTAVGAPAYKNQNVEVVVQHELTRNIILTGNAGYTNDDFESITRNDDIIDAGLGVRYLVNRNADVQIGYDFTDRNSDVAGYDYTRNQIGFTLRLKL